MKSIIKWFAGFFEDKAGSASSKRATLYISLFFEYVIIQGNLEGKTVDDMLLYVNTLVILFCLGAVTSEFFKENVSLISSSKTSVTKTETKEANNENAN